MNYRLNLCQVAVAVAVVCIPTSRLRAETTFQPSTSAAERWRAAARFAGGTHTPQNQIAFVKLFGDHHFREALQKPLSEEVPPLPAEFFKSTMACCGDIVAGGQLVNVPPGLINERPKSLLWNARVHAEQALADLFGHVCQEQPISSEEIDRVQGRLQAWEAAAAKDAASVLYVKRVKSFVQYQIGDPQRRRQVQVSGVLCGGSLSFPGGTRVALVSFVLANHRCSVTGSQAATHLSAVCRALIEADEKAEKVRLDAVAQRRATAQQRAAQARQNRMIAKQYAARMASYEQILQGAWWQTAFPTLYRTYWSSVLTYRYHSYTIPGGSYSIPHFSTSTHTIRTR